MITHNNVGWPFMDTGASFTGSMRDFKIPIEYIDRMLEELERSPFEDQAWIEFAKGMTTPLLMSTAMAIGNVPHRFGYDQGNQATLVLYDKIRLIKAVILLDLDEYRVTEDEKFQLLALLLFSAFDHQKVGPESI